jgi:hypothetical protein
MSSRAGLSRGDVGERKVFRFKADVAQSVEHSLGKGEVVGSIPIISSRVGKEVWARAAVRGVDAALLALCCVKQLTRRE